MAENSHFFDPLSMRIISPHDRLPSLPRHYLPSRRNERLVRLSLSGVLTPDSKPETHHVRGLKVCTRARGDWRLWRGASLFQGLESRPALLSIEGLKVSRRRQSTRNSVLPTRCGQTGTHRINSHLRWAMNRIVASPPRRDATEAAQLVFSVFLGGADFLARRAAARRGAHSFILDPLRE